MSESGHYDVPGLWVPVSPSAWGFLQTAEDNEVA